MNRLVVPSALSSIPVGNPGGGPARVITGSPDGSAVGAASLIGNERACASTSKASNE